MMLGGIEESRSNECRSISESDRAETRRLWSKVTDELWQSEECFPLVAKEQAIHWEKARIAEAFHPFVHVLASGDNYRRFLSPDIQAT